MSKDGKSDPFKAPLISDEPDRMPSSSDRHKGSKKGSASKELVIELKQQSFGAKSSQKEIEVDRLYEGTDPYKKAGLCSKLWFNWVGKMVSHVNKYKSLRIS